MFLLLDETDFCSHCRLDKTTDTIQLYIHRLNDRENRLVLKENDLNILIAFLEKKDVWDDEFGNEHSLQSVIPRLRVLLGIDKETTPDEAVPPNSEPTPLVMTRTMPRVYGLSKK